MGGKHSLNSVWRVDFSTFHVPHLVAPSHLGATGQEEDAAGAEFGDGVWMGSF